MRKYGLSIVAFVSLGFTGAKATFAEFDEVPVTRWVEGGGARLKSLAEVRASGRSDLPFSRVPVRRPATDGVYVVRLRAGSEAATTALVITKP